MRTTGNRKKANSRISAGSAGQKPLLLENMDSVRLDSDGHPAAGGRQRTARRLTHQQLAAVLDAETELEAGAELDRFDDLAGEGVGPRPVEPLRPHQYAHLGAGRLVARDPE